MRLRMIAPAVLLAAGLVPAPAVHGQTAPLEQVDVQAKIDSGWVVNRDDARGTIWSAVVTAPERPWVRLRFDEVVLGRQPVGGEVTILRMTSLADGAEQRLNTMHLGQWRNTSAYFNGDAVLIEIVADSGAEPSRFRMTEFWAGERTDVLDSICGPTDDRLPSDDPRAARLRPVGCSGWLIDDANHCFLTAGHCTGSLTIAEFNVPLSNGNGSINFSHPDDQYPVDPASLQSNGGQGVGNDYAYFGCFANPNTGLTAFEAQGDFFTLAFPPPAGGEPIRITGYGTTGAGVPPEWNQIQKTHTGPFVTSAGTTVQYQTDTTGGNSGSPVIFENTGEAIGIHTHGGCDAGGGQNSGTGVNHQGLQDYLANPRGVCIPDVLRFEYPNGLPELINPAGDAVRVEVQAGQTGQPEPGTGRFFYDAGNGFTEGVMQQVSDHVYDALFPGVDCGTVVAYYFTAETTTGDLVTDPINAPTNSYSALAAVDLLLAFDDDFESDLGWTIVNQNVSTGEWERAEPVGSGGGRGDPPSDFDGSGKCMVTGNGIDEDLDGGPTILTSPVLDLSAFVDPQLSYARWHTNDDGDDFLVVEISGDNGQSWTLIESVGDSAGWNERQLRVADFVAPSAEVLLRFTSSDQPNNSVTESGVDAVRIFDVICDTNTFPPRDFNVIRGRYLSGGLAELRNSDDAYLRIEQRAALQPGQPLIQVEVEGQTNILSPSELRFTMEANATALPPTVPQELELFNYASNQWDLVDSRTATSTDTSFTVTITVDPADYVNPGDGEIRARMSWLFPGNVLTPNWGANIDQAIWEIFE